MGGDRWQVSGAESRGDQPTGAEGQGLVEYALILFFIVAAVVGTFSGVGPMVALKYAAVAPWLA